MWKEAKRTKLDSGSCWDVALPWQPSSQLTANLRNMNSFTFVVVRLMEVVEVKFCAFPFSTSRSNSETADS